MPTMHRTSEAPPDDHPDWGLPAALILRDGRIAELPDVSVRDAVVLVASAREFGELIGGTLDPDDVTAVGVAD